MRRELIRVAQAVGLATAVSVAGSMWLGWMFFVALPVGAAVGTLFAAVLIARDRRK